jgi:isopenicillin N synthase-like dioxygenase
MDPAPAVPGTFVVNTGAMLARYSNDRFRLTPHRVINRNGASCYAIPFFLAPNHDAVVDCVPTCVGPDNPPHYEPTTYRLHPAAANPELPSPPERREQRIRMRARSPIALS